MASDSIKLERASQNYIGDYNCNHDYKELTNFSSVTSHAVTVGELTCAIRRNSLFLNSSKTTYLRFHTPQKTQNLDLAIKVGNEDISRSRSVKFLGLTLDHTLGWKEHCDGLRYKLNNLCFLVRNEQLLSVYNAYITSRLHYGICFWGASPASQVVFVAQKRVIRCMLGLSPTTSCRTHFRSLGVLTLTDSEGVYGEALQKAVEDYGKTYPPGLSARVAGTGQHNVAKFTIELLNIDTTIEEFLKIYTGYSVQNLRNLDLMPGAERLIKHLSNNNIPIALATSSRLESIAIKIEKHKHLFSRFHHVVSAGSDPEVTYGKPAPDIFLVCASRFPDSPDPSKCLVFEDAASGVKAALAAGMQVVMIPYDDEPYDTWKTATLRLDSLEFLWPPLFGLPPFPEDEAPVEAQNSENLPAKPVTN